MKARNDVHAEITAAILKTLEAGAPAWTQPWVDGHVSEAGDLLPRNAATGRPYRGLNVPALWAAAAVNGYQRPLWLTYRQAQAVGAQVRKGERASLAVFWKAVVIRSEDGQDDAEDGKRRMFAKRHPVFNVDQVDGLPADFGLTRIPPRFEHEPDAARQAFVDHTAARIGHGGNRAYYQRAADRIQLPHRDQFKTADGYYETAFHELAHWTGHDSRLNRTFGRRFGDHAYALEELVAELTAAFICAATGNVMIGQHAGYLDGWKAALKADDKAFSAACSRAQAAADHLWSLQPQSLVPAAPRAADGYQVAA